MAPVRALAAAAAENLEDRDTLYQQLTGRFHGAVMRRLQTGIALGQIRADADIGAAADALIGATLYRMLSVTATVGETMGRYDGLVDVLMSGLSKR
ncbi:TetR/AcrR family transcriptional regulator C-terminal ligand-binding domain-containing protein [Mycobacterium sp. Marseille-P9652]|uniref:TetR/AcrR family transcriptional regulator C-terminal ligand-binding domain-containing protein n=1 Tax=Mycobacterium sp. Marseille-P9652 TaxID=2654950 RepID=UPI001E2E6A68|nr:TetR/AcrR family transcriptional regulator C-terminal ligand-binding domain-containing protein [Mycobacterium sp. Marseille-P9652]